MRSAGGREICYNIIKKDDACPMKVTVSFEKNWLDARRHEGIRVVRMVEKWVAGREGVKLISSTAQSVSVELNSDLRPAFSTDLEKMIVAEFKVEDPLKVMSYGGEGSFGQAAAVMEEESQQAEMTSAPKPEEPVDLVEQPSAASPEQVLPELMAQVPIKHSRELAEHFRETAVVVPMLRQMDALESFWRKCLLIAIDDGYGLTEFLSSLARLYAALGLIKEVGDKTTRELRVGVPPNSALPFAEWEEAVDVAKDTNRSNVRNQAGKAILCLDIGAWQGRLQSSEIKRYLRQLNVHSGSFTLVLRVPFVDARTLAQTEASLSDVFDIRTLTVSPASVEALAGYAADEFAKRGFSLAQDARDPFERWILEEKRDDSFFGYRTVDKMVCRAIYSKAVANCRADKAERTITDADLQGVVTSPSEADDPYAELNALIGLTSVKTRISEIVAQIKTQRKLTAKGRKVRRPAIHMLFSGNPGTGKTTVARLVARILKQEGVLRKGHLVEVKGRDLCGEYVGQTAPKTSAICRDAYGSVLFIDEAYSLFRGDGNDRDYGREALDTLIAEMENHRDDMCVIMAGYAEDMERMLGGNEGLKSRIPHTIEFPDYGRDELVRIFFSMLDGTFAYEQPLEEEVKRFFDAIPDEVMKARGFANARLVRNLYERTWGKAAYRSRLDEKDEEIRILASDLVGAAEENEFKQLMERSARRPIGFGAWCD